MQFFRSHLQRLGAEDTPKLIQNQGQLSPSLRDLWGLPGPSITCCAPGRTGWVSSRLPTPLRKLRGTKWSAFSYISLLKINKYLLEANGRLIKITVSGNTATSLLPLPPKTHPLFLEELLPLLRGERETHFEISFVPSEARSRKRAGRAVWTDSGVNGLGTAGCRGGAREVLGKFPYAEEFGKEFEANCALMNSA